MSSRNDARRSLEALRIQSAQREDAAADALAAAVAARAASEREVDRASAAVAAADESLATAHASPPPLGVTAVFFAQRARWLSVLREACAAARAARVRSAAALSACDERLIEARRAVGEARGRREAVEQRLTALSRADEAAAELQLEDEAGDRFAATQRGRSRAGS